jgi:hypothetical protein
MRRGSKCIWTPYVLFCDLRAVELTLRYYSSYESLGQEMSGWFSAKPIFDCIAEETKEAYLA